MKNLKLLPIAVLAAMILGGCASGTPTPTPSASEGPNSSETQSDTGSDTGSSSDTVTYGVAISNKADFAEVKVGDTVDLDIALTPEGNVMLELNKGNLTVTSSNAEVAVVNGVGVTFMGSGEVTITVAYHGETDTVSANPAAQLTPKQKYQTVHEGTAEDPFDNEDAVKVGLWAKDNGTTPETDLYIKGTVSSFYHAPLSRDDGACSFFLTPATAGGAKFEVYKCYKTGTGAASYLTKDDIWKDAVVTAYGPITYYAAGSQAETSYATWVKTEGEKPADPITINATVAGALEVGLALEDGDQTWDYYAITGYVVRKSGDNYFLSDTAVIDDTTDSKALFELYNIKAEAEVAKLTKGAKVKVTCNVKNYHGQIENGNTPTIELLTAGQPWNIAYTDATVAEALVVAKALADGATTTVYYKVTGIITAITEPYSSYGNMSFTIADTADGETLTVFRLKMTEAKSAEFVVGATVVVGGQLQNYVKDGNHTYEVIPSELFSVTPAGGEGGGSGEGGEVQSVAKYTFSNTNSTSAVTDGATIVGWFSKVSGESIVTGASNASYVYPGANGGKDDTAWSSGNLLKIGKASAGGSLTLALSQQVKKVVITGYGWKDTLVVTINTVSSTALQSALANKTTVQAGTTGTAEFVISASSTLAISTAETAVCITAIEFFA